jgi:tetratricopeptide (TPR) repeat protein
MTPSADKNRKYLDEHFLDFVGDAFQSTKEVEATQPSLASPPGWTENVFSPRANEPLEPKAQLALHQNFLMSDSRGRISRNQQTPSDVFTVFALAHLAIRNAHDALRSNPNSWTAYTVIADTCLQLGQHEELVSLPAGGSVQANQSRRYFQAVTAFNQAILANPDEPSLRLQLGNLYLRNNRRDLALREFDRFLEFTGPPEEDDEAAQEQYKRRLRMKKDLESQIEAVQTAVDKEREKTQPGNLVRSLYDGGFILLALKLLREESENGELPENDPFVLLLQLEAGEIQTAYTGLMQLEGQIAAQLDNARVKQFGLPPNSQFRHAVAMAALCVGDYDTAIEQWVKQAEEGEKRLMLVRLGTLPMVNRPIEPITMFMQVDDQWPYLAGRPKR